MSNQKPPSLRVAVVGGRARFGVRAFSWKRPLPNLTDYDAAVLDLRSLAEDPSGIQAEDLSSLRQLASRLIRSNGVIVVIVEDPLGEIRVKRNDGREIGLPVTSVLPFTVLAFREFGETIFPEPNQFSAYTNTIRRWKFHFDVSGLKIDESNSHIATSGKQVFLRNREGKTLAGQFWFGNGRLVVLPSPPGGSSQDAVDLVLGALLPNAIESPPPWVDAIDMPGIAALNAQLDTAEKELERLTDHRQRLLDRRADLAGLRKLIYTDGTELERVVADAFTRLGGQILSSKFGTEEYILLHSNREHLVEVKGVGGTAALKHVRQLVDNLLIAEEKNGTRAHGILLVNTWRDVAPNSRDETADFPANVIERAEANNITLISSLSLFRALCVVLDEKRNGVDVLDVITTNCGVVRF